MSSKTAQQTNGTSAPPPSSDLKYEARLCHVVKRADFDGYGFNLHAEKGRPGQYIGKVDDGSPAESAGLRQGDRIIEVNGTNITSETHKKVVELIKAVPNETRLLVIDPRAEGADLKAAIAKSGTAKAVDVNDNSKQMKEEKVATTNGKDSLNESHPKKQQHDVNGTSEEANNKKNAAANNNLDTSANKMVNGGDAKTPKSPSKPAVDQIIEDTKALTMVSNGNGNGTAKAAEANGKPQNGTATKEGPKLNLNMTAAELRAQLAARKKYDPKNDVTDLRKKYEIIQKM